jgi:thioredoxin-like negative regulator of GroEL
MKRKSQNSLLLAVFIPIIILGILAGCGKKEEPIVAPTQINFAVDYQTAMSQAQQKNQKVIIDFYTDWCTWCKRLDTVTFIDSAVIAMSQNIVFAKINAEVDTATARKYSVQGFPTVILLNADGTEIDRIGGYLPPEEFTATIDNYLKGIQTLDYFLKLADSAAGNEVNMRIGEKYADRGMPEKAEGYFSKVIQGDPDNKEGFTIDAIMSIADIKRRAKNYDDAVGEFKKIMEKFPGTEQSVDAELWMAIVHRQKGDTTAAIKAFEEWVKNHPDSPDTSYANQQIEKLKNPPPPDSTTK